MRTLSLLQTLSLETAKETPAESAIKPEEQYQVYVIERDGKTFKVGIPLDKVDAFDAVFVESPDKMAEIELVVESFGAIQLD